MRQADIFERAAQCERASGQATDPERKIVLALLREMWISVANESPFLSEAELGEQVAIVETIHGRTLGADGGGSDGMRPPSWAANPPSSAQSDDGAGEFRP